MIKEYYLSWKKGELSDALMATYFFIIFHEKKYPNKKLKLAIDEKLDPQFILESFVFKKVKSKALTSLKKWLSGEWNLKLLSRILTPYEVLTYQAKGIRPVTIKIQDNLTQILHKKDSLEFFLHDLEHAHMFFFSDELKEMQIRFFINIEESLKSDLWTSYLSDKAFEERFFYLISDMNTHREHYRSFLNSMLDHADITRFEKILFM